MYGNLFLLPIFSVLFLSLSPLPVLPVYLQQRQPDHVTIKLESFIYWKFSICFTKMPDGQDNWVATYVTAKVDKQQYIS